MNKDCANLAAKECTSTSTLGTTSSEVAALPTLSGALKCEALLPLSEIQSLAEKPRVGPTPKATSKQTKTRIRKCANPAINKKNKKKVIVSHQPLSKPMAPQPAPSQPSSHSELAAAIELGLSKGLRGGFIEFLRSNTDESIKKSFDEVKKELANKQSFLKSATTVVRYLQAARLLYNRLDWRKKRKYEQDARYRIRMEHIAKIREEKKELADLPLFDNGNRFDDALEKRIGMVACPMPSSEYVFKDRQSLRDFKRYEALKSRKICCPLCPISSEVITSAVQYQGHMTTHHSCAHLFACHFCGFVFPSLEALKAHDGCEGFATAMVQRINLCGEVDCPMGFAIVVMTCTDCGSQQLVRSSFLGEASMSHWNEIINFHMAHNAESLVPLIIYSSEDFNCKMRLRLHTISSLIKDVQITCPYCGKSDFDTLEMLESHFLSHNEGVRVCPVCSSKFGQEAFYREHLLSHLDTKAGYLALYLAQKCTFVTGGLSSCGPYLAKGSELIYGGVSAAVFTSKLRLQFVDPWESVTVKKKANRRGRKRRAGAAYKADPAEVDDEQIPQDETSIKIRKLLGQPFDYENVLRVNGFFYTAIDSKDETEESAAPYNTSDIEFTSLVEDSPTAVDRLAKDISEHFTRICRLAGGKTLSKKHNPSHVGFSKKIYMCRRCNCICTGDEAVYSHLSQCCPELRRADNSSEPYDLSNGLLVICVYAGSGLPNTRITCWECSSTVCSVFGLRVHMIAKHGIFIKAEDESTTEPTSKGEDLELFTATTRAINKLIGLTENGCLPVNLEERKKEALRAKMKLNQSANGSETVHNQSNVIASPRLVQPNHSNNNSSREAAIVVVTSSSPSPAAIPEESPPSVQIIEPQAELYQPRQQSADHDNQPAVTALDRVESLVRNLGRFSMPARDTPQKENRVEEPHYVSTILNQVALDDTSKSTGLPQERSLPPALATQKQGDLHANTASPTVRDDLNNPECEFCGLKLMSQAALTRHYASHSDTTSTCYLCDPPQVNVFTPELYLAHIHAKHTTQPDASEQGRAFAVCSCCDFRVKKSEIIAHLMSDCYMAPCLLCGDKLSRRNDRITHRKNHKEVHSRFVCECRRGFSHFTKFLEHQCRSRVTSTARCAACDVKFSASSRNKVLKDGADHFIKAHTKDLSCCLCKNEPLEALREHVSRHLILSTESCKPSRSLLSYKNVEISETSEETLHKMQKAPKERSRSTESGVIFDQDGADTTTDASDAETASVTLEDATTERASSALEELLVEDVAPVENGSSRDGSSPSVLEKQRQVLAELLDDLGPPPSVVILESSHAVHSGHLRSVREEEDPQCAVPKNSVADDEDEIVIVDESAQQAMLMSPPPPGSVASAVVHTINEGDEDCMMMNIVELPTGSVSSTVASTREKKYKCSTCSQSFLRESSCRLHEQTSHRNDIGSDLCNEDYGIPLELDRCMYLCQQCTVAFEDQQRARKHLAQHMIKGPAFPCEKCSSICLTEANLRDHLKKHAEQKLSYRCLKCTPHQIYYSEVALYYHLYVEHRIPIIAFCKSCLLASANMDRIFKHTYTRECSDRREEPRMTTVPILLRTLGFAIASELYFQPNDEAAYKKAIANKINSQLEKMIKPKFTYRIYKTETLLTLCVVEIYEELAIRFAVPTQCCHRTFITFGDAFTTCPEDPARCHGLVNQNRWHSFLCATNRDAPGEMPAVTPEAIIVKKDCGENLADMLLTRYRTNLAITAGQLARRSINAPPNIAPAVSLTAPAPVRQGTISTCQISNRRQDVVEALPILPQQVQVSHAAVQMPTLRQTLNNAPISLPQNQSACIFCRCRNVAMICEPPNRAYEAVNSLCTKFREVHPVAAQTLYSSLNSFIRETVNRRHGQPHFCFCRWHYSQQSFDGQHLTNAPPSQVNSALLLSNYHKGLFYPDPACVAIMTSLPLSPVAGVVQAPTCSSSEPLAQSCAVCGVVAPAGLCSATAFRLNYMIAVPLMPVTVKEQWAASVVHSLAEAYAQRVMNEFRISHPPRLCIRHFNPRSLIIGRNGAITRNPNSVAELPILDFPEFASLTPEFFQAFNKLLDAMDKNQNSNNTIATMLKIVQDLVKCKDERCGRPLNLCKDVLFHRFHGPQHTYVCMECFCPTDVIRTEQEMIEHFVAKHIQRSQAPAAVPRVYSLHCPLRNCSAAFPSVQTLRKHINHIHAAQFPHSSDNCATHFFDTQKMTLHNTQHEKHSCDVTCCYLCGLADPWQHEFNGVRISHELTHGMRRFLACKTCGLPMGQDPANMALIDHFMKQHMVELQKRVRYCKICRKNVGEPDILSHVVGQHRLISFSPRYVHQGMLSIMNGSEMCAYLGIPPDRWQVNPQADVSELG